MTLLANAAFFILIELQQFTKEEIQVPSNFSFLLNACHIREINFVARIILVTVKA
jgi:hypothetical protein